MNYRYPDETKECAFCRTVLKGRVKAEMVNKSYISIRGMVSLQMYDKDNDFRYYQFISPKPTEEGDQEMNFCNAQCFADHIRYKQELFRKEREEKLRREASDIATHRVTG